jgi:serralysin
MANFTGDSGPNTIVGTSVSDQISGLEGNDILDGGGGDDVLIGGSGADTLTGGTGADSFRDTAANFNGDRITDFLIGDRIQFTDLTTAGANIHIEGSNLVYNGGSIQIDNLGPGRFVLREITGGGIEVRLQSAAHNDFNGDGFSDILWRNDGGVSTNWLGQANGGLADNGANFTANPGTQWQVEGTADFNGDGRIDLLWRHESGVTTNWLGQANGSFADNAANFIANPGTQWQVSATGDFNGDGRGDIIWRHVNGVTTNWLGQANGAFSDNAGNFIANPGTQWQVAGTGDFNGDGRDDILWRHESGLLTNWLGELNGGFTDNGPNFSANPGTSWHVVGIGDFNGDGRGDILWRNDMGVTTNWLGQTNGGFADNGAIFTANPGTQWQVAEIADFNGDAIDDILWRHDNGTVTNWLGQANGAFADNAGNFSVNPGTQWHVQDPSSVHDPFA